MLRNLTKLNYTTANVIKLLEYANDRHVTNMEVANLRRPGKLLERAYIGHACYDRKATDVVIIAILRRRLASELGRTSPRLMDLGNEYICPECQGIAVKWEGLWKCEQGHTGRYEFTESDR